MVTPEGHLYSKEAILENLLAQKKAIRKRVVAFEAQQQAASDKVSGRGMRSRRKLAIRGCQNQQKVDRVARAGAPCPKTCCLSVDRSRSRLLGALHT